MSQPTVVRIPLIAAGPAAGKRVPTVTARWSRFRKGLRRLQTALLRYGESGIMVTIIPWHLQEPRIEEGLEKEEEETQWIPKH